MDSALSRYAVAENGCWNWTGPKNRKGYGQVLRTTAHRHFYISLVGPVPADLHVDHLCENTSCVNPVHLEPVTPSENAKRRHQRIGECLRCHLPVEGHGPIRRRGNPLIFCSTCYRPETAEEAAERESLWGWLNTSRTRMAVAS